MNGLVAYADSSDDDEPVAAAPVERQDGPKRVKLVVEAAKRTRDDDDDDEEAAERKRKLQAAVAAGPKPTSLSALLPAPKVTSGIIPSSSSASKSSFVPLSVQRAAKAPQQPSMPAKAPIIDGDDDEDGSAPLSELPFPMTMTRPQLAPEPVIASGT